MLAAGLGLLTVISASAREQRGGVAYYPLPPGSRVSVENIQGSIRVEGWDRAEVEVVVIKTFMAPDAHPEDVVISVEQGEGNCDCARFTPGHCLDRPAWIIGCAFRAKLN